MKRHEPDLVSLVFALIFLLLAAMWPLWRLGALGSGAIAWLPATALVLIGLLGVVLSVARSRATSRAGRQPGATTVAAGSPYDAGHVYDADPAYAGTGRKRSNEEPDGDEGPTAVLSDPPESTS